MQRSAHLLQSHAQANILIVDDDPTNVAVLHSFLEAASYNALEAFDGRQAIEMLDRITPDLILLDLMMPEIDGFEVCRLVKSSPQWQAIPVIIITALDEVDDYTKAMECGANDFLSKPVELPLLMERVNEYLQAGLATKKLRQSETLYRRLIECLPDGILVISDGRLTFVNPAGMHLLGAIQTEELMGKPVEEIIHPMYKDNVMDHLIRVRAADVTLSPLIVQFIRLDCSVINVHVTFTPFSDQGEQAALLVLRHIDEPVEG